MHAGTAARHVTIVVPSERLAAPYVAAIDALEEGLRNHGLAARRVVLAGSGSESGPDAFVARIRESSAAAVVAVGSRVFARLRGRDLGHPLVFTMVLNPSRIDPRNTFPGVRLDVDPADLLAVFHQIFPSRQRIGVVYDPATSTGLLEEMRGIVSGLRLRLELQPVRDVAEVPAAQRDLAARVDAFLLVPDRCSASQAAFTTLRQISFERRLPILALKPSSVRDGAALCTVIDYAEVGRQTAEIVATVADGKDSPGPVSPRGTGLCVNRNTLEYMAGQLVETVRRRVVKWYPEEETDR